MVIQTLLYVVFSATFGTSLDEKLFETYAADLVWDGMYHDDSIDALLTRIKIIWQLKNNNLRLP